MITKFENYKTEMKRGKRKYEKSLRKATGRRKGENTIRIREGVVTTNPLVMWPNKVILELE